MSDLARLHTIQLEIMDEIHRICEQNKINYSLIAGSLLGAIRHEGFIPWDDDLDVGMKRDQYEKFLSALEYDLNDNYYIMSLEDHNQYGVPFIKVMKKNTAIKEGNLPDDFKNYGIFIDVFPFDNVPKNKIRKTYHDVVTEILKKLLLAQSGYNLKLGKVNHLIYQVLKPLSKLFSRNFLIQHLERNIQRYNDRNSNYLTNIGGSYGYTQETIKKEWFNRLVKYKFENRQYWGFKDYDAYLTGLYGDYLQLPDENDRYDRHDYDEITFNLKK